MTDPTLAVLYVDDDPDIRIIVDMALRLDPLIDLRAAASGDEALALLAADGWQPDVIVLDVMMPGLSGPETLARLRAVPRLAAVPALFMTARGREVDRAEYQRAGAVGTIVKPFDPLTLAADIRALVLAPLRQVMR